MIRQGKFEKRLCASISHGSEQLIESRSSNRPSEKSDECFAFPLRLHGSSKSFSRGIIISDFAVWNSIRVRVVVQVKLSDCESGSVPGVDFFGMETRNGE